MIDEEWYVLIKEAKDMNITIKEIKSFLESSLERKTITVEKSIQQD